MPNVISRCDAVTSNNTKTKHSKRTGPYLSKNNLSMKTECDYLNGWIKERKISPKMVNPKDVAGERRSRIKNKLTQFAPSMQILQFDRSGFKPSGPLEQASVELIKMAAAGNFLHVEELLNCGSVHPDVADKNGHTALIGATVSIDMWLVEWLVGCLLSVPATWEV